MTSIRTGGDVEFRFFRPNVGAVTVAGDFSQGQGGAISMTNEGDGWWVATLRIPAGEYRFRYCADGQWYTDYASHGVEHDKSGWNSVLVVPAQAAHTARDGVNTNHNGVKVAA